MPLVSLMFLAALAGAGFVMQSTVNAQLRSDLTSPFWAGSFRYLGGTIVMAVLLIATGADWPRIDAFIRNMVNLVCVVVQ